MPTGPNCVGAGPRGLTQHGAPAWRLESLLGTQPWFWFLRPGPGRTPRLHHCRWPPSLGAPRKAGGLCLSDHTGSREQARRGLLRRLRAQAALPGAAGWGGMGGAWRGRGETLKCRTDAHASQRRRKQKAARRAGVWPVETTSAEPRSLPGRTAAPLLVQRGQRTQDHPASLL